MPLTTYDNSYLYIFADCILVDGLKYCLIQDLSRGEIYKLPASYFSVISKLKDQKLGWFKTQFEPEDYSQFEELVSFLLEHELAAMVDDISVFPELSVQWDSPEKITNAIIDYRSDFSNYSVEEVLVQLFQLGCQHLEFRSFNKFSNGSILKLMNSVKESSLESLELTLYYNETVETEFYLDLLDNNYVISLITIFNAQQTKTLFNERHNGTIGYLIYTDQKDVSANSCGIINKANFVYPDVQGYAEFKNHNSCLNRKISVDEAGYIKNCPSMLKHFGHVSEQSLASVVENVEFNKLWNVTKSEIETCKSCEFRFVCTDCRAFVENPEDEYSKPLKCGYDPRTGIWEDWSTHYLNPDYAIASK